MDRKQAYIEANQEQWILTGSKYRDMRIAYNISLYEMVKRTGYSRTKLVNFESGDGIISHKAVIKAYQNAFTLHNIDKIVSLTIKDYRN